MPERHFRSPSATSLIFAAIVAMTVVFVRCGPKAPPDLRTQAIATPSRSPEPEPAESETAESAPPAAPSATPPSERRRYVVATIGDSLTDARSHGGKFLDYLRQRCPESRFDNYGKGGDMVNQMHKRFASDVLGTFPGSEKKPAYTHLIVFGGVNDLYSDMTAGRTPELVGVDLGAMYRAGREHGMKIVALTVTPWGGFTKYWNEKRKNDTKTLNDWIRRQKTEGSIDAVIDAYELLSGCEPDKLCPEDAAPYKDGIHFGAGGHEKIGRALFEQVFRDCR